MRSAMLVVFLLAVACLFDTAYADVEPLPFVKGSWTLVLLPDTEYYAREYPQTLVSQTRWIADSAAKRNIKFVMAEGDIVHDQTAEQWGRAKTAYSQLDGLVPYALVLGNHDFQGNPMDKRVSSANKYFTPDLLQKSPAYGGVFEKGKLDNAYYKFSAGERDWIALSLELAPRDEVVEWANRVLAENANRSAIICTHAYLNSDGTRFDYRKGPKMVPDIEKGKINDGEMLWRKMVSKHANVMFVFCGHVRTRGGAARLDSRGDAGNTVHQILADYQAQPNGGDGYLRLMEFLPDGKTVQVRTYSPTKDNCLTEQAHQFTLEIPPLAQKTSNTAQ